MGQTDDPEQLREELRHNRAEISETLDAIQERLNPDRLKSEAGEAIRGATIGRVERALGDTAERVEEMANKANYKARDTGSSIFDTIKSNPLPSALAGLGLGWLFMNRSGSRMDSNPDYRAYRGSYEDYRRGTGGYGQFRSYREDPYYREHQGSPLDTAREKMGDVAERVTDTAGTAREEAGEMFEDVRDRAMDTGSTLMDSVRENPIPSALVGLGLGWFLVNRSSGSGPSSHYGDYSTTSRGPYYGEYGRGTSRVDDVRGAVGETAGRAGDTMGNVASKAQETVGGVASAAQETVGGVASAAQDTMGQMQERAELLAEEVQARAGSLTRSTQYHAGRVEDRFQEMVRANPLGVVAAAVAVGTAVGMALPGTQRENELLGETRDNFMDQAKSFTQETVDKVQRVADEVKDTAKEEMKNEGITK